MSMTQQQWQGQRDLVGAALRSSLSEVESLRQSTQFFQHDLSEQPVDMHTELRSLRREVQGTTLQFIL